MRYVGETIFLDCFNNIDISIDSKHFCVSKKLLFYEQKETGSTEDIDKIKIEKEEDGVDHLNRVKFKEYVCIYIDLKKYKLAPWINKIEKQQLVKEIYSFLEEINNH